MKSNSMGTRNILVNDGFKILSEIRGEKYKEYRRAWAESCEMYTKTEKPLQLNITLTDSCNLNCNMCYRNHSEVKNNQHMTLELADEIIRQAKEVEPCSLFLGGGAEGLMNPNIKEILVKFGELNTLDYWFLTNGILMTEDVSEVMVDIPLTWVSISIDAAKHETYKKIRGRELDTIKRNIEKLIEVRKRKNSLLPFIRVSFVVMEENKDEVDEFLEYWRDYADMVSFQQYSETDPEKVALVDDSALPRCTTAYNKIHISYEGKIKPCCHTYYDYKFFDIKDISLYDYWHSDFLNSFTRSLTEEKYVQCCKVCLSSFVQK